MKRIIFTLLLLLILTLNINAQTGSAGSFTVAHTRAGTLFVDVIAVNDSGAMTIINRLTYDSAVTFNSIIVNDSIINNDTLWIINSVVNIESLYVDSTFHMFVKVETTIVVINDTINDTTVTGGNRNVIIVTPSFTSVNKDSLEMYIPVQSGGDNYIDYAKVGKTVTDSNTLKWAAGKIGYGVRFDSLQYSWIDIGTAGIIPKMSNSTTGAISFWIKMIDTVPDTMTVICFGDENDASYLTINVIGSTSVALGNYGLIQAKLVIAGVESWNVTSYSTGYTLRNEGIWRHFILMQSGTGQAPVIYRDGVLNSLSFGAGGANPTHWLDDMSGVDKAFIGIGNYDDDSRRHPLNAILDEMIFFSRKLWFTERIDLVANAADVQLDLTGTPGSLFKVTGSSDDTTASGEIIDTLQVNHTDELLFKTLTMYIDSVLKIWVKSDTAGGDTTPGHYELIGPRTSIQTDSNQIYIPFLSRTPEIGDRSLKGRTVTEYGDIVVSTLGWGKVGGYGSFNYLDTLKMDGGSPNLFTSMQSSSYGSINIWVRFSDVATDTQTIVGFGDTNGDDFLEICRLPTPTGPPWIDRIQCRLVVSGIESWNIVTIPVFSVHEWNHIGLTHRGGFPILFLDGNPTSHGTLTGATLGDWFADATNIDNATIGHLMTNDSSRHALNASVDEFFMTNRWMSSGDMLNIAGNPIDVSKDMMNPNIYVVAGLLGDGSDDTLKTYGTIVKSGEYIADSIYSSVNTIEDTLNLGDRDNRGYIVQENLTVLKYADSSGTERTINMSSDGFYPDDSTVLHLTFEDTNMWDYSKFGNTPIDSGGTEYHTDSVKVGTAARRLDHTNFLVIDSVIADVENTAEGTWLAWVRPDIGWTGAFQLLISFGDGDAAGGLEMYISNYVGAAGVLQAWASNQTVGWNLRTDERVFFDQEWTHIALVQDGVSPRLYINGSKIAQTFTSEVVPTRWFFDIPNIDSARIGCRNGNTVSNLFRFSGIIDEVIISKETWTEEKIKNYYYNSAIYSLFVTKEDKGGTKDIWLNPYTEGIPDSTLTPTEDSVYSHAVSFSPMAGNILDGYNAAKFGMQWTCSADSLAIQCFNNFIVYHIPENWRNTSVDSFLYFQTYSNSITGDSVTFKVYNTTKTDSTAEYKGPYPSAATTWESHAIARPTFLGGSELEPYDRMLIKFNHFVSGGHIANLTEIKMRHNKR